MEFLINHLWALLTLLLLMFLLIIFLCFSGKQHTHSEQPIFTCQAHVFHIDPKTKRTWITASMKAVNVSFFYDSSRNLYRIISVEGTKAVINSTITPSMTFTQTSQKFGQWSDVRANTVYGLGFSSEAELTKVPVPRTLFSLSPDLINPFTFAVCGEIPGG